ncbi:hypothetical protein NPIL_668991 [Nephila pilipes]|uniref:Uncharacterized protein n=1 Tax=Nephila pilipes TaxID=299642 RepID=A0A8X6Q7X1_NEPPI|nr:hypothetical protein NPIL_668991 [Nephila pilipes]
MFNLEFGERNHSNEDQKLVPATQRRIVSQRIPTPEISFASKIKKKPLSCTTQTDSSTYQSLSTTLPSSKTENRNGKGPIKSPRKNKHTQIREAMDDRRKNPPKI